MALGVTSITVALATMAVVIYGFLAHRIQRRQVRPESQAANTAWYFWWRLLAASTLVGTVATTLLAAAGYYTLPVALTLFIVNLFIVFAALWALSFYLAYVVTGRHKLWRPIAWFYAINVTLWLYVVFSAEPTGTTLEGDAAIVYQTPLDESVLFAPLVLGILLPAIGAAMAYGYLAIKAPDRTVRFRIGLVATSIIVWFGASLIATFVGISDWSYWPITSRLISLAAATTIYIAHFPPAPVVRRLGLRPIMDDPDKH